MDLRRIWEGFYWCRTYTPFEKELRRYSDWEGPPCMCWDGFEKVIWWGRFEKELRRYSDWEGPPCMYWDGFEKVILLGRFENAHLFTFEKELRRFLCLKSEMDLRRWEESEKEMYPPKECVNSHFWAGKKIMMHKVRWAHTATHQSRSVHYVPPLVAKLQLPGEYPYLVAIDSHHADINTADLR